jgi:hypothetical protein
MQLPIAQYIQNRQPLIFVTSKHIGTAKNHPGMPKKMKQNIPMKKPSISNDNFLSTMYCTRLANKKPTGIAIKKLQNE